LHRNPEDTVLKLVSNYFNPAIVLLEGLSSV
jgi:hypothetical protein